MDKLGYIQIPEKQARLCVLLSERDRHFNGFEADKQKYNDLPVVKRRHRTTSGKLNRQAAPKERSGRETRSNMFDTKLDSREPTQGTPSTAMTIGKLGDFSSLVARGS